ncbi:hypothetical protein BH09ACT10_BH09ACT10_00310 [soil metagenome]
MTHRSLKGSPSRGTHRDSRVATRRLRVLLLLGSVLATSLVATISVIGGFSRGHTSISVPSNLVTAELTTLDRTKEEPSPATSDPLPRPPSIPESGAGVFAQAPGSTPPTGSQNVITYRVEVERELPWDPIDVASKVEVTLADPRGWRASRHECKRSKNGTLRVLVATPTTVDRLCAPLLTRGQVSCRNGNLVVLNALRWSEGIEAYRRIDDYRTYLINHEVGHALGQGHRSCPKPGAPAPVMQQQTKSLQSCRPNPWPTRAETAENT